jgi:hypothetical protein
MQHRVPSGDEGPWLRMASRCGTGQFLQSKVIEHDLYFEKKIPHPEDNRSPLYPFLIKAVQLIVKDYFTAGQILNCVIWITLFIVVIFSLTPRIGKTATLVTLLYLSLSPLFFLFSAHVYPDLLIALTFFVLILCAQKWVRTIKGTLAFALIAGALIVTKSTGVFIFPVFLYYVYTYGKEQHFLPKLGLFTFVIALILLPWILRNYREFGSPLYQFSEYNLYVDNFNYLLKVGIQRPSLTDYIHEKGAIFLLFVRPIKGTMSLLMNFPKFDEYLSVTVLPFACIGVSQLIKKKRVMISIGLFTIPYFLFMGYIAYAVWVHRFTMILYLFLYIAAGAGVTVIYQKVKQYFSNNVFPALLAAVITILPLFTLVYPLEYYFSLRGSDSVYDKEIKNAIEKTKKQINARDVVFSSYASDYCYIHDFAVIDKLDYKHIGQLTDLLNYYKVSCLMLNREFDTTIISDLQLSGYLTDFTATIQTENLIVYQKF